VAGDDACAAMSMVNGIVSANVDAICLGPPCAVTEGGLYLGVNVSLFLGAGWTLSTTSDGLTLQNGTLPILTCAQQRCYTGSLSPFATVTLPPGLYSGAEDYNLPVNGVWFGESVMRFIHAAGVHTVLNVHLLADPSMTGVMWVIDDATYVFTNWGMLVVGNATTDAILANRGSTLVLAEGPVVLNTAILTNSCRPGQLLVPLPPEGLNNILQITSYAAPSVCGNYAYGDESVQTLYLTATACYLLSAYPAMKTLLATGTTAFQTPSLCPALGSGVAFSVVPYTQPDCTKGAGTPAVLSLGVCSQNVVLACYNTL
jgi:hypothetical protein